MLIYCSLNKWIDVHQQTGGTKNIANTHENFDVMPVIGWICWKKSLHQITIEKILIVQIWSDWLDENTSRTAFHRFWHFFFGQKFLDAGPGTPAAVGRRAELVSDTFSIQISRFGPWKITDCQANLVAFGPNNPDVTLRRDCRGLTCYCSIRAKLPRRLEGRQGLGAPNPDSEIIITPLSSSRIIDLIAI